jgi:putative addiction module killer protein
VKRKVIRAASGINARIAMVLWHEAACGRGPQHLSAMRRCEVPSKLCDGELRCLRWHHKLELYPSDFNDVAGFQLDTVTDHRLTVDNRHWLAFDQLQPAGASPECRSPVTYATDASLDDAYPFGYTTHLFQLQQTEVFSKWLSGLKDARAKARLLARLESARQGNFGDVKSVGGGVSEMRVNVGAGYRIYFFRCCAVVIILLCGGDKSTQTKDISRAKLMAREIDQE